MNSRDHHTETSTNAQAKFQKDTHELQETLKFQKISRIYILRQSWLPLACRDMHTDEQLAITLAVDIKLSNHQTRELKTRALECSHRQINSRKDQWTKRSVKQTSSRLIDRSWLDFNEQNKMENKWKLNMNAVISRFYTLCAGLSITYTFWHDGSNRHS